MISEKPREGDCLREYIVHQVDNALEDALNIYDPETLKARDTSLEEMYFNSFNDHVQLTIGKLCKTTIPFLDIDYTVEQYSPLVDEHRRLCIIWATLRCRVEDRIDLAVNHYLKASKELPNRNLYLVENWPSLLTNCRSFISRILPSLEYITINYPSITKEVNRQLQISDYFMIYLINLLKFKLAEEFESFLEEFLSRQRKHTFVDKRFLASETPLKIMFRYKIPVNTSMRLDSFYLRSVGAYAREQLHIPIGVNYGEIITKVLIQNALVAGSISASLVARSNDIILRQTIMDSGTTLRLLQILVENTEVLASQKINSSTDRLLAIVLMTYESRSEMDKLWDIYSQFISLTLKNVEMPNEKRLEDACKLLMIASRSEHMEKLAVDQVNNNLKGSTSLVEQYLKVCETSIRRFNQIVFDGNSLQSRYHKSLALNLPLIMSVPSSFLTLYCRSLFRRCIVHGLAIIKTLTDPSYFEYHLLLVFQKVFGTSAEYDGLQTLKTELLRSAQIANSFDETRVAITLEPLLFEKKNVPLISQSSLVDNLALPVEMRSYWNDFESFYKAKDSKAQFKKLHLIDSLQHCEVQTQIKLEDSTFLILDLTLYQTCVLTLFNEENALSIKEVSAETNMPDNLLDEVLDSFIKFGLLIKQKEVVMLNDNFSLNGRRIKNGKLRVPVLSTKPRSSREGSAEIMQHMEGLSSHWKQEIIKACIVRSLKGEEAGVEFDALFAKVETQMFGISFGEFKDALRRAVLENSITQVRNLYKY